MLNKIKLDSKRSTRALTSRYNINLTKSKRSQVTIFVIAAILIIGALAIFFLFRQEKAEESLEVEGTSLSTIPGQIRPVYSFAQDCLIEKAKKGLEILRLQGGYIFLPLDMELVDVTTIGKHVSYSNGEIELVENTGITKVPVWLDNRKMRVPSLEFMEEELEKYLEGEVEKCTGNFDDFRQGGMEITPGLIDVDVKMKNIVNVKMDWAIKVDYREESYGYEDFPSHTELIDMEGIYDVLSSLVIYELGYEYLEHHAKNLISLYSYAGGGKQAGDLPPFAFSEVSLDCDFASWSRQEVENNMKNIFRENYKYLKMENTNFERVITGERVSQGVYDGFIHDYFPEKLDNIHIDFSYQDSDLNLNIKPSSLMPDKSSVTQIPFLPVFCVFDYGFDYTFSTPIVVKIKDDNSRGIDGKEYEFYFPMKVYVCNNKRRSCGESREYQLDLNALEELTGEKFYRCEDIGETRTINVKDEKGEALEDVQLTHYCEGFSNSCWLGSTDEAGKAVIEIPKCEKSELDLIKKGYGGAREEVKSDYVLDKVKDYEVEVKLIDVKKFAPAYELTKGFTKSACGRTASQWFDDSWSKPNANDEITIYLEGAGSFVYSYPIDTSISLSAGTYTMNAMVNSEVRIKPSNYEGNEVSFNQNNPSEDYVGKWLIGASSHDLSISKESIDGKNKVLIYVLTEHLSTENLEVKSFENPLITETGLNGEIKIDENCDGVKETKVINILKSDYQGKIEPKFS